MTASNGVDLVLRWVAGVFVVIMVAMICLQVAARYGFSSPPAWTEEAARYAMVWVGLLGASISFKAGFDPALMRMSPRSATTVRVLTALVRASSVMIFLAPVLWYCFFGPGMNTARSFLARSLVTTAETFDMPSIFVAASVPIFIVAIFLHGAAKCLSIFGDEQPHKEAH
ncbi:TRAP transporter small permease [Thalassospira sp. UBA1131]|uniref:TRAP transporter small permease n=1 Tax=Thalassospira sp. UBA1131 TaxID=1947672 RepID=UPI0025CF27FF|nr:TRAP transporter small permease subunit [Thalassospira sp. UBA1131]